MADFAAVSQAFQLLRSRSYTPPKAPSVGELAAAYADDLADLTDEEVSTAVRLFVRDDVYGRWPTPGAIRAALGTTTDWAALAYGNLPEAMPERYQRPAAIAAEAARRFDVDGGGSEAARRRAHRDAFAQAERAIAMVAMGAAPPTLFPLTQVERSQARYFAHRLQRKAARERLPLAQALLRNASHLLETQAPDDPSAGQAWLLQLTTGALDALDADSRHDEDRAAVLADLQGSQLLLGGA